MYTPPCCKEGRKKGCKGTGIPMITLTNEGDQLIANYDCLEVRRGHCVRGTCHCSAPVTPQFVYENPVYLKNIKVDPTCKGFKHLAWLHRRSNAWGEFCCLAYKPALYAVKALTAILDQSIPIHEKDLIVLAPFLHPGGFAELRKILLADGRFSKAGDYWLSANSPAIAQFQADSESIRRMKSDIITKGVFASFSRSVFFEVSQLCREKDHLLNVPYPHEITGYQELNVQLYRDMFFGCIPFTTAYRDRQISEYGYEAILGFEAHSLFLYSGGDSFNDFFTFYTGTESEDELKSRIAFAKSFGPAYWGEDEADFSTDITVYTWNVPLPGAFGEVSHIDISKPRLKDPANWWEEHYSEWYSVYYNILKESEKMESDEPLYAAWDKTWRLTLRTPKEVSGTWNNYHLDKAY